MGDGLHAKNWLGVATLSQRQLLGLARVLIANPHVLCIHKPTQVFTEEQGRRVLASLQEFVHGRGLALSGHCSQSRPRTCIMSNVTINAVDFADMIFYIHKDGVRELKKDEVQS